ncbi:MAG TPA: hypothetical protein VMU75_11665 [Acidimicrobiales bacterium]|nr:hypothetical protein [Acidimicrobiales bacterium]
MSGYIEAGYIVTLGALGVYAASLVGRERSARRRLPAPRPRATSTPVTGAAAVEAPADGGRSAAPADEGRAATPPGPPGQGG